MQHRNWLSFFFVFMLALCTKDGRTAAQQNLGDLVNNNTVGLISAGIEGTYVKIASDLSKALDNKYNFRVVPIIGKGSKKNIEDLLYLEGVDLAIVQSDVLDFYGRDPEHKFPDIDEKVFYITKLYNEEVHLIARRDITSIGDLAGMKVSYGPEGGGSALTAENIFDVLGVRADFVEYHYVDALKELRQGNIQALIHVAGKKVKDYETIPPEDGLHLLSLPEQSFDSSYQRATFSHAEYPGLVPEGQRVGTLSVASVLAAYNWDASPYCASRRGGQRKVDLFANELFQGLAELQSVDGEGEPQFHKKWQEVDLRASVPSWRRLPEMSQLLGIQPDQLPPPRPCE